MASEKRAATATAQAKQAYWAVRGTQVTLLHAERNIEAAIELKERLAALGAVVMLKQQEAAEHAGKLYYGADGRDAALQIKASSPTLHWPTPRRVVSIDQALLPFG